MKLDFGCGNWRKDGYVGVDIEAEKCFNIDKEKKDEIIKWDLDNFPYPFFDEEVCHS